MNDNKEPENATRISRNELALVFDVIDPDHEGKISKVDFVNSVYIKDSTQRRHHKRLPLCNREQLASFIRSEVVSGSKRILLDIPNDDSLKDKEDNGVISHGETLSMDQGWQNKVIQNISNFLFQSRMYLGAIFRAFDVNNDGFVSRTEFLDAMRMMNDVFYNPLTDEQVSPPVIIVLWSHMHHQMFIYTY